MEEKTVVDEAKEDLKALEDVTFFLNDLICVVCYGGNMPILTIAYDEDGRPQVQVALDTAEE